MLNLSITIITPSYNQGHYLEQTIDSVLSQNYPNLEYIIIDGGSTDQSVEIIKKYAKHLAYWASEPDQGQSNAINKGLQMASGEIVNWINSDDYYEKDALLTVSKFFEDNRINVVCGRGRIVKANGEFVKYSRGTDIYEGNLPKTIGWARIDQPETFFRRSVFEKTGMLSTELHYVMDKALWINYLLCFDLKDIRKINDVLINFRLHDSSKTVSQSEGFQNETMSLFYTLAQQYELNEGAGLMKKLDSDLNPAIWQPVIHKLGDDQIRKILHYYLLQRADEYYYTHQRSKSKECLKYIDVNLLDATDRSLYYKLQLKNNFLPVGWVKMFRK